MKLLYFAWLRSRIGVSEEDVLLPPEVRDVAGLLAWLAQRGPGYAAALAVPEMVRVAVNRCHVGRDHSIAPTDEVALFPPTSGG